MLARHHHFVNSICLLALKSQVAYGWLALERFIIDADLLFRQLFEHEWPLIFSRLTCLALEEQKVLFTL